MVQVRPQCIGITWRISIDIMFMSMNVSVGTDFEIQIYVRSSLEQNKRSLVHHVSIFNVSDLSMDVTFTLKLMAQLIVGTNYLLLFSVKCLFMSSRITSNSVLFIILLFALSSFPQCCQIS